jgi:hypothetical protein
MLAELIEEGTVKPVDTEVPAPLQAFLSWIRELNATPG